MNIEQMRADLRRRQRLVLRKIATRQRQIEALRAEQDALREQLVSLTDEHAGSWASRGAAS